MKKLDIYASPEQNEKMAILNVVEEFTALFKEQPRPMRT
jgi:hypothetical protein